jgi:hypothetical protein
MQGRSGGILQIFLGLGIPAIFLAISLPGGNGYSDSAGLATLFPWLIVIAPTSILLLIRGIYQLIHDEFKQ